VSAAPVESSTGSVFSRDRDRPQRGRLQRYLLGGFDWGLIGAATSSSRNGSLAGASQPSNGPPFSFSSLFIFLFRQGLAQREKD